MALVLLLLADAVALAPLLAAARGLPVGLRISIAVVAVAPLGLLMGVPFASGIRWAGAEAKRLVPWAWAVNGGASVFGSTLAVITSMAFGFTATWVAGAFAYGLVCAALIELTRTSAGVPQRGDSARFEAETVS